MFGWCWAFSLVLMGTRYDFFGVGRWGIGVGTVLAGGFELLRGYSYGWVDIATLVRRVWVEGVLL